MFFAEQLLIFIGVFVLSLLLWKWKRKKKDDAAYPYPPSLPSLPLLGSLPFIRNLDNISVFFKRKAEELGPIFTFRVASRLVLTLNSTEAIEKAYVKNFSAFTDRPEMFMEKMTNLENKGIGSVRKASDWKKQQQLALIILKDFGFGVKNIMETRISKEVEEMIDFVTAKQGKSFDPNEMCSLVTSNVILNILFGRRRQYNMGQHPTAIILQNIAAEFSMTVDILPFFRYLPSFRKQMNHVVEGIESIIALIEKEVHRSLQDINQPCFANSYVQKLGPNCDRAQLNYMLKDLFTGGTETTSTTLQWSLIAMANNPEKQKRLQAEIDNVITGDRLPTLQDQAKLPYVEATILEISRWRTVAPLAIPRETSRDCLVDGFFIPGGTTVFANLHAAHHDIKVWKDPEIFRPERFLDSENNVIGRGKITPFSVGRRSCLGETLARAELFLIFTSLVKRFLILPPEGQNKLNEDPVAPVSAFTHPKAFKIRLMARN